MAARGDVPPGAAEGLNRRGHARLDRWAGANPDPYLGPHFAALLDQRLRRDQPVVPVVFVRKTDLPRWL